MIRQFVTILAVSACSMALGTVSGAAADKASLKQGSQGFANCVSNAANPSKAQRAIKSAGFAEDSTTDGVTTFVSADERIFVGSSDRVTNTSLCLLMMEKLSVTEANIVAAQFAKKLGLVKDTVSDPMFSRMWSGAGEAGDYMMFVQKKRDGGLFESAAVGYVFVPK